MQGVYKLNLGELASLCFTLLNMSYAWNQPGNHPTSNDFMQVVQNITINRELKDRQPMDEDIRLIHVRRVLELLDEAYLMWDTLSAEVKHELSYEYKRSLEFPRNVRNTPEIHEMLFGEDDSKRLSGIISSMRDLINVCQNVNRFKVTRPEQSAELAALAVLTWHEMPKRERDDLLLECMDTASVREVIHSVPEVSVLFLQHQPVWFASLSVRDRLAWLMIYFTSVDHIHNIDSTPGMPELFDGYYEFLLDRWGVNFWEMLWDA